MTRKWKSCLLLGLVVLLTACSSQQFISEEPTAYTHSQTAGVGKMKTVYLSAEHPDVKQVIPIVEEFLKVDQTQDYHNPDWEKAVLIATEKLIVSHHDREIDDLIEHTIIKELQDCHVQRIVFMGKDIDIASVTATVNVLFESAGTVYANRHSIRLGEPAPLEATINLKKYEDVWLVDSTSYTYLTP